MQVVDDAELVMLETVDWLLGRLSVSDVGLVLAKIHGNSANMTNETAWDLFSIWFDASPNSRRIIARSISVKLQGGSYRKELYRAWGEYKTVPQDKLNELISRIGK